MKTSSLVLVIVLFAALVGGGFFYFRDTKGPEIALIPAAGPVSSKHPPTLQLADTGSGLKSVTVTLSQGDKTIPVLSKEYPEGTLTQSEPLPLEQSGIKDGPAQIRVVAVDRSIFPLGAGSTTDQTFIFEFDNKAPVIALLSRTHNLTRGGSGLVTYTLSEDVARTGVMIGERFFPGYQQPSGNYACLFSFPWDMNSSQFVPKVIAVDPAGNERQAGFYYHTNDKPFRQRQIPVSSQFLEAKMPPFEDAFPEAKSPLEVFLKVNSEMRKANVARLTEFGSNTSATPLWEGDFLRQPQAATLSLFADHRTYTYEGQHIDQQTHLGVDLASTAQADILAANHGRVVFADDLGIYGLCVILDHGLGLQTLYGHLSRIDVSVDQTVSKGQVVGASGATGMAGGDHLHFETIVSGLSVTPIEWWDGAWIRNNITDKLSLAPTN
ncbi:M23 family metallopeptidase [Trichloromonas sp.]|uniref:M23 family metallopeptidase n=1 Tax=Trichloromonas sp. TaxID=3069249 RepID=UPI003D817E23